MAKSFVKGALILAICGLIGKIIGAFYRIPFSYIVGAEGLGLYQLVYPLFTLVLTISTSGLPRGISKLLSEQWASGRYHLARKTFKYSMMFLLVFSLVGSALIAFLAFPISKLQGNTDAFGCYIAIAPAVFFVGIISGIRGYFQAKENMLPTAISGLIEQVAKLAFGLGLAYMFRDDVVKATIGALCGVTISEVIASIYLLVHFRVATKRVPVILTNESEIPSNKEIIWQIVRISLPIALGGLIMPITLIIDSSLIVKILSKTFSSEIATNLYGLQSGVVGSLSNLPVVASVAVATAVLPKISKEYVHKSENLVQSVKSSLHMALLIALPIAICFYIFSEQIILFLYHKTFSQEQIDICILLLKISSINIVFLSVAQVSASVLQGLGKVKVPLYTTLIGSIIKIVMLVVLVNIPSINIYGAEISDAICYGIIMLINIIIIHKNIKYNNVQSLAKVAIVSVVVGGVAYLGDYLTFSSIGTTLSLIVAGGCSAIVYVLLVLFDINAEKRKKIKFAYQKVGKKRKYRKK